MDKIICLGKNYRAHASEMNEAQPEKPVLFLKPPSCLTELKNGQNLALPWSRGSIHHECEVVLKLYKKNVIAVSLGLDLTLRDLQKKLKDNGHPWEISKSFKHSALVAPFIGQRDFPEWRTTPFNLKINGEIRQQASLPEAIFSPDAAIHHADDHFPICDGDLVFTGTPQGVGPLNPGDQVSLEWGPINLQFRLIE
jgi:2-keto-4-pentenoate hydratase/2-oxohepta-3-ene-1,7-dioic acid hydratase in catechol pathway